MTLIAIDALSYKSWLAGSIVELGREISAKGENR